jgi:broad specificity phosphatase PhoE
MGVLLLVRHGQASFGGDDYDVLSELGFEQARLLGARLATPVDAVLTGRLQRQRETVQGIRETLGYDVSLAQVQPELDEYDMRPVIQGDPAVFRFSPGSAAARARANEALELAVERWVAASASARDTPHRDTPHRDAPDRDAPDGETFAAFTERVGGVLAGAAERPGVTLAVTSGGVISAVAAELLGLDTRSWIKLNRCIVNTSVSKVLFGRSGRTLVSLNDHAHLEHEARLITYR